MSREHKKKSKSSKKKASETEEEHVVEVILKKRMEGSEPMYLVKWKDWPHSSNTWEPVSNLNGCPDLLPEFERTFNVPMHGSDGPPTPKRLGEKKSKPAPSPTSNDDSSVYDSDVESGGGPKSNSDEDVLAECPSDRVPDELLGVVPSNKEMTYLVKWKPKSEGEVEPYIKLIKGDVFKVAHPQVVIEFYMKRIIWTRDGRAKEVVVKDAMMELDKSKVKVPDASVYPQDSPQVNSRTPVEMSSSGEESEYDSDDSAMEVDPTVGI